MGDYYGAYRAMEEAHDKGLVRAIGVCNFYPHILADFVRLFASCQQLTKSSCILSFSRKMPWHL